MCFSDSCTTMLTVGFLLYAIVDLHVFTIHNYRNLMTMPILLYLSMISCHYKKYYVLCRYFLHAAKGEDIVLQRRHRVRSALHNLIDMMRFTAGHGHYRKQWSKENKIYSQRNVFSHLSDKYWLSWYQVSPVVFWVWLKLNLFRYLENTPFL